MSSLKPQLNETGFRLFAVVHELKGVEQFKPFFDGEVYLDAEVSHHIVSQLSSYIVSFCYCSYNLIAG